jgi:predicted transposase YbfD/YdcC
LDSKSNEHAAIPKPLESHKLAGILVAIDAMGYQTEIAKKIVNKGADYCLAVKRYQPKLQQGMK